jgi:hypothetical protein
MKSLNLRSLRLSTRPVRNAEQAPDGPTGFPLQLVAIKAAAGPPGDRQRGYPKVAAKVRVS